MIAPAAIRNERTFMPLYPYKCKSCGEITEEAHKVDDRHSVPMCHLCKGVTELTIAKRQAIKVWDYSPEGMIRSGEANARRCGVDW